MLKLISLVFFLFASAAQADAYLNELQHRAALMDLAASRGWQALLHYESNGLTRGVTSTVATPGFFIAAQGRTNPQAELQATVAAFFENRTLAPHNQPARCVFPARYAFLQRKLNLDNRKMPVQACPELEKWQESLAPQSISLVFPSAYLNSPASMFGHTLLRIDGEKQQRGTELLSYAINFAANTEDAQSISYAYKGLTGGYPGLFGVFPYYEKVKQYAWIESRDVWSYRLKFSPAEMQRLLAHLWEMRGVRFDYYFLTKNCSYQLLSLIQAARPSLRLVEQFNWYAIPADTIRALRQIPGLLGPAEFRPALRSTLANQAASLTADEQSLADAISEGALTLDAPQLQALPERERARVLEVAHDLLYYRFQSGEGARDQALKRARAILLARSRIPVQSSFTPVPAPRIAPDAGHNTLRLGGSAVWEDDNFSLGLRLRPAYHDLLDPPGGYSEGAQINILDIGLRLDPDDAELKIENLTLLDIVSLSPRDQLFKPISWQVATGFRRRPASAVFTGRANNLGYFLEGGAGLAWGNLERAAVYGFALASADANTGFDPDYALGAGASAGVLMRLLPEWTARAEIGGVSYEAGGEGRRRWAFLEQQIPLPGRFAVRSRIEWEEAAGEDITRAVVTLQAYY